MKSDCTDRQRLIMNRVLNARDAIADHREISIALLPPWPMLADPGEGPHASERSAARPPTFPIGV